MCGCSHLLGHVYTVWFMHLPAYANSTPFKRDVLLRAFKVTVAAICVIFGQFIVIVTQALQANQAKTPDEVTLTIKSVCDSMHAASIEHRGDLGSGIELQ